MVIHKRYRKSILKNKAFRMSVLTTKYVQFLVLERREYVLSKQLLRSCTSIGANLMESEFAESHKDYIHKFSIALKESNEFVYWLDLVVATGYDHDLLSPIRSLSQEILKMLIATVKTLKSKTA